MSKLENLEKNRPAVLTEQPQEKVSHESVLLVGDLVLTCEPNRPPDRVFKSSSGVDFFVVFVERPADARAQMPHSLPTLLC